jgi:hypothetical protein
VGRAPGRGTVSPFGGGGGKLFVSGIIFWMKY